MTNIEKYKDLWMSLQKELRGSNVCCGGKAAVIRKYQKIADDRDAVERRIYESKNRGA